MIIVKNGEKKTVNTTSKAIDVLFYFQPKEKPLTASQFIIDEEYQGSMRDKGKDLIDQAREVQLKKENNSAEQLDKNYNSTRHKSKSGEAHPNILDECLVFNNNPWFKTLTAENFREDKLSEANMQKEINKGLREQEVLRQWEINPEDIWNKYKINGIKEAIQGYKETANKVDYSEINLGILDLMAERFSANKGKYEKRNSKKPLDKQQILWALFRHVKKMVQPIEGDEENFKDHLAAVLTNCSILLDQLEIEK